MDEQIWMSTRETGEVSTRPSLVSEEAFVLPAYPSGKISARTFLVSEESFVLPAHPTDKVLVEAVPNLTECRGIELPKVSMPASQNLIESPRNVRQSLIALQLDMPAADASVDLFHRVATNRRKEIRVNQTFQINTPSRTERVAEKVKADSRIIFGTINILAINDT